MPVRVLLVDDHMVVREGIARLLEQAGGFRIAAEAATGSDAVTAVRNTAADVCVLDLDLPGGGITLIERLRESQPGIRILVFSQHQERDFAIRCLEAGALGYLNKEASQDDVVQAVRRVAAGGRFLTDAGYEVALDRLTKARGQLPHEQLSFRELEVVRMLARGRRNADIAIELGISTKTVSTHRTNALAKLGLNTDIDLAVYAREHKLI